MLVNGQMGWSSYGLVQSCARVGKQVGKGSVKQAQGLIDGCLAAWRPRQDISSATDTLTAVSVRHASPCFLSYE